MARAPDILDRTAPALSATYDGAMTDVQRPPVSASNDPTDQAAGAATEMSPEDQAASRAAKQDGATPEPAKTEPTETPVETTEAKQEPATETKPDPDAPDPNLPDWAVREISKARVRQREADKAAQDAAVRAKEAEDRVAAAEAEIAKLRKPPEQPEPRPARDKFDDQNLFDEALAAWGRREGAREALQQAEAAAATEKQAADEAAAKAQQEQTAKQTEAELTKINADWQTKKTAAIEKYPDFVEVVEADSALHVSPIMAHAMMRATNGADVAYYLAKNPDEATRILQNQSAGDQIFEMGLLSARLATQNRTASRAPKPVTPLRTTENAADTSDAEPSMEAYAAKRLPDLQAARRSFLPTKH